MIELIEKMTLQMIKTFTSILFGLFLSMGAMAQENQKNWRDGKLTWQDFSEKESNQGVSELKYFFSYNADKLKFGDTTVIRIKAKGYMDKKISWINPAFKKEQYLRYNQVIFDIIEVHRRRLQVEIDKAKTYHEIEQKFNQVYKICNNEIEEFSQESNKGQDLNSISFWEQKISVELQFQSDKEIPEYKNGNFGYAFHAGFGPGFFSGSLGEHFTPTFNFIFGFDFAYKKSILYLTGTLAGSKVRKDYLSDENWIENQRANMAILDISYGYALIDNEKIKLSPFAGLGITELTGENKDDKENGLRMVDYNMIFGINTDYKINTRLKFVPNSYIGEKEKVETSIRARIYITRVNYYEDLQGYSINLAIGLCGFGNMIRVK